jgi:hypothetical protein
LVTISFVAAHRVLPFFLSIGVAENASKYKNRIYKLEKTPGLVSAGVLKICGYFLSTRPRVVIIMTTIIRLISA